MCVSSVVVTAAVVVHLLCVITATSAAGEMNDRPQQDKPIEKNQKCSWRDVM